MDEHAGHDHGVDLGGGGHDHSVECYGGNEYDGRMGLRISAIFVIGFGSMLGMYVVLIVLSHVADSLQVLSSPSSWRGQKA
jgi:hypothetical protein